MWYETPDARKDIRRNVIRQASLPVHFTDWVGGEDMGVTPSWPMEPKSAGLGTATACACIT